MIRIQMFHPDPTHPRGLRPFHHASLGVNWDGHVLLAQDVRARNLRERGVLVRRRECLVGHGVQELGLGGRDGGGEAVVKGFEGGGGIDDLVGIGDDEPGEWGVVEGIHKGYTCGLGVGG